LTAPSLRYLPVPVSQDTSELYLQETDAQEFQEVKCGEKYVYTSYHLSLVELFIENKGAVFSVSLLELTIAAG
jgi:hypothetical protein